ncbi:serine hydrolase [Flavobacterium silvaticum]|uniref:Serine hydrolase n=1 Tax=Flavobacterium silvaticum TaxID=1852020 RepID=A0A972FIJ1_9FLAO|nr:serine hydrolase [Flavobacterium silvaticum]NMH26649.1 serine hydrolase [Flavobacterium silvaticum]
MNRIVFVLLALPLAAFAQISEQQIDAVTQNAMKTFNVPGIAVGVVKDGQLIYAKGHGVASVKTKPKVDANTLFGIASNSKAFTSAALAILMDEGKLSWDDKVSKYIPEFKMYNDYVTTEFTIRDLLTHRSGLGLGAGDLMVWPDGNDFGVQDIIDNLKFLKPTSAFRTKYDYDNLLYIVAGEIVHRVSGVSWEEFVETRLMQPVGMTHSAATFSRLKDTLNVIDPHVPVGDQLKIIPKYKLTHFDAAGGIYSSVNDLSKWVIAQLNDGKASNGTQLFSKVRHDEMWTPQTILPNKPMAPYFSQFKTYGLGWGLTDVKGKLQVSHTGGLEGNVTQVLMIPELKLGIIVLTNQQSGAAFTAISNTIKDFYLGISGVDHVTEFAAKAQQRSSDADKITDAVWKTVEDNSKNKKVPDLKKFEGTFTDNWFGQVTLTLKKGKLYFASKRSHKLTGEVFFYKDNTLAVKWDHRTFDADAYLFFDGNNHFTMKPISPLTDFSYDFQDLDFKRTH